MIYDVEADRAEQEVIDDIIAQNVDGLISRDDYDFLIKSKLKCS